MCGIYFFRSGISTNISQWRIGRPAERTRFSGSSPKRKRQRQCKSAGLCRKSKCQKHKRQTESSIRRPHSVVPGSDRYGPLITSIAGLISAFAITNRALQPANMYHMVHQMAPLSNFVSSSSILAVDIRTTDVLYL